jgi:ABC-type multidrug transport system ATPase subunit
VLSSTSAFAEVLELTDLADRSDERVDSVSGGMKCRLNMAVVATVQLCRVVA